MRRLATALATVLTLLLGVLSAVPAGAHQTGRSTFVVHVKPDTREVDTLLTCPVLDVAHAAQVDLGEDMALDVADAQRAWPALGTYLDRHLDLRNDGQPCEVTEQRLSDKETPGHFFLLKAYRCAEPLGQLVIRNDAMTETEGGYQHLGQIQVGEAVQPAVFTALTPTVELNLADGSSDPPSLGNFVVQGIIHIVLGWDHVLFVLALVLMSRRLRDLLVTITAFTLAHSVTLALSALDVVTMAPSIVEPIIALSIVWVAIEAALDPEERRRAYVATFALGLVHGFGFSYVLRDEIGLPPDALAPALLLFNVGVELGQLGIVALAYPLRRLVRERSWERKAVNGTAAAIAAVGLYWLIERLFS